MFCVLVFVLLVWISLFVVFYIGIFVLFVVVISLVILFGWRWFYLKISLVDLLRKVFWYIFVFVFMMYIIIYGFYNIGLIVLFV